jgi:hypothetical protein
MIEILRQQNSRIFLATSIPDVSAAPREHWWMNQGYWNSDGDA